MALLSSAAGHAQIRPQSLVDALAAFARQTGLQLIYESEIAHNLTSKGIPSGLAPAAALSRLLAGTGLSFEFLNERSVRILVAQPVTPTARVASAARLSAETSLDEVLVTAEYRHDTAGHVPISMGVWTAEALEDAGAKDFAALANLTPGVDFAAYPDYSAGIETNVAIRGVNANDGSTVGVYIDDTPIPSDRASSFGRALPAIFGLERVEVLRGPHGVLFGEGAQGGAIRFITAEPQLMHSSGAVNGEVGYTQGGARSYEAGLILDGPVAQDRVGIHLSTRLRRDGGFVDRVNPYLNTTVDRNANWVRSELMTAAARLEASDSLTITPAAYYQATDVHDTSAFFLSLSRPGDGRLRNGSGLNQYSSDRFSLLSLKGAFRAQIAELSSVTGYIRRNSIAIEDNASADGLSLIGFASAKPQTVTLSQSVLSEQLRAASVDRAARLAWIVGASYVRAAYEEAQDISTSARADGGALNGFQQAHRVTTQIGAYGQLDWRWRPKLTVGLGLRIERGAYDSLQAVNPLSQVVGSQTFRISGAQTPLVPRISVAYQPGDSRLHYVLLSKGYRMGGPNDTVGLACPVATPLSYKPDSLWNFEIGTKNSLQGGRVQVDASVFRMAWQDMQTAVPLANCGFGFIVNAGSATSNGIDLSLQTALTAHFRVGLSAEYVDARHDQTVTLNGRVVVAKGDAVGALPLVAPPWSVTASLAYQRELGSAHLTLSAQGSYHGRNPGPFSAHNASAVTYAPARQANPATNVVNLRASSAWSALELTLFVQNAFESHPVLHVRNHISTDTLLYATTFRPLTLGIAAKWRLESRSRSLP